MAPARQKLPSEVPSSRFLTLFFRSLVTMVAAGLPITRSLRVLGQHSDDRRPQALASVLEQKLMEGSPLSASMGL